MSKFPLSDAEVLDYVDGNDAVLADNFDELYKHYTDNGEMPYGTAKARDGDPDQWIHGQLEQRARAIRFYTDTSHPSVGDGDRVHRLDGYKGTISDEVKASVSPDTVYTISHREEGNSKPIVHIDEGFSPSKRVRDAVLETLADRAANPVQIPLGFIVADTGNKK